MIKLVQIDKKKNNQNKSAKKSTKKSTKINKEEINESLHKNKEKEKNTTKKENTTKEPTVLNKISLDGLKKQFNMHNANKQIDTNINIHKLSEKIQWLIDLSGTDEFMDLLKDEFTEDVKIVKGLDKTYNGKKTLYFYTQNQESGHWYYVNKEVQQMNSYTYGHQKKGSNQFCQSFALIYMLTDFGHPEYFNRLVSANNVDETKKCEIWGNNIEVVLSLYYDLFMNYFDLQQQEWIINELKDIIKENKKNNRRNKTKETLDDSNPITMKLIEEKMADIHLYRYRIAEIV